MVFNKWNYNISLYDKYITNRNVGGKKYFQCTEDTEDTEDGEGFNTEDLRILWMKGFLKHWKNSFSVFCT